MNDSRMSGNDPNYFSQLQDSGNRSRSTFRANINNDSNEHDNECDTSIIQGDDLELFEAAIIEGM